MKLEGGSATLKLGVDRARELIDCLPPYGSLEVDWEMLRSRKISDKFEGLFKVLLPIPVHHPDLPALVVDFNSGAKRVAPYIAQEAKKRLPEITAYLKVTERNLSREIAALRRSPKKPSLKDKVEKLKWLRLTLQTLKQIGKEEVEIEAVPLGDSKVTPGVKYYLEDKFGPDCGTPSFPDRPVPAD